MVIHQPKNIEEAVNLRHELINSAYLAGGTEVLRLGATKVKDLIDITNLVSNQIEKRGDKLYIGARVTLQTLKECELVPSFIREAASFCYSFEKRNSATVGGNLFLKRSDSYLLSSFAAAEAEVILQCHSGEKIKPIDVYLTKACRGVVKYFVIDANREGTSYRFGRTKSSHAALIAAKSNGIYAISASGSKYAIGNTSKLYKAIEFTDDITGSAEYKKYLAKIVFEEER